MWWDLNLECVISTSRISVVVWMGSVHPKTLFFDRWYSFDRLWKLKVCSFTGVGVSRGISFGDLEYCLIAIYFLCFPCLVWMKIYETLFCFGPPLWVYPWLYGFILLNYKPKQILSFICCFWSQYFITVIRKNSYTINLIHDLPLKISFC